MGSEPRKEVNDMAHKKGNGDKSQALQRIALITAIINLLKALVDIIRDLIG